MMKLTAISGDSIKAVPGLEIPAGTIKLKLTDSNHPVIYEPVSVHVLEGGGGFPFGTNYGEYLTSVKQLTTDQNGIVEVPEFVLGTLPIHNKLLFQSDHAHLHMTLQASFDNCIIRVVDPANLRIEGLTHAQFPIHAKIEDSGYPNAVVRNGLMTAEVSTGGGWITSNNPGLGRAVVVEGGQYGDFYFNLRLSSREENMQVKLTLLKAPQVPPAFIAVQVKRPRLVSCGSRFRNENLSPLATNWLSSRVRLLTVDAPHDAACGSRFPEVHDLEVVSRKVNGDAKMLPAPNVGWRDHTTLCIRPNAAGPYKFETWLPDFPDDPKRTIEGRAEDRLSGYPVGTSTHQPGSNIYVQHSFGGTKDDHRGVEIELVGGDYQVIGPNTTTPHPLHILVKTRALQPATQRRLREIKVKFKVRMTPYSSNVDAPGSPTRTPGTVSVTPGTGGVDELELTVPGNPGSYPLTVYFNSNERNYDHAIEVTAKSVISESSGGSSWVSREHDTTILARGFYPRPRLSWAKQAGNDFVAIEDEAIIPTPVVDNAGNALPIDRNREVFLEYRCHDVGLTVEAVSSARPTPIVLKRISVSNEFALYRSNPILFHIESPAHFGLAQFSLASSHEFIEIKAPYRIQARVKLPSNINPRNISNRSADRPVTFLNVVPASGASLTPDITVPDILLNLPTGSSLPVNVTGNDVDVEIKGEIRDLTSDLVATGTEIDEVLINGNTFNTVSVNETNSTIRPHAKVMRFAARTKLRPGPNVLTISARNVLGGVREIRLMIDLVDPQNDFARLDARRLRANVSVFSAVEKSNPHNLALVNYQTPHGQLQTQFSLTCHSVHRYPDDTVEDSVNLTMQSRASLENSFDALVLLVPADIDATALAAANAANLPVLKHSSGNRILVKGSALPHRDGPIAMQNYGHSEQLTLSLETRKPGANFQAAEHVFVGDELRVKGNYLHPAATYARDVVLRSCDRLGQVLTGPDREIRIFLDTAPDGSLIMKGYYDRSGNLVVADHLPLLSQNGVVPTNANTALRICENGMLRADENLTWFRDHHWHCAQHPARQLLGNQPAPQDSPVGTSAMDGYNDSVLVATGEVVISETDAQLTGRSVHLAFSRTYRSYNDYDSPMGHQWTHSYHSWLHKNDDNTYWYLKGDGRFHLFKRQPTQPFEPPAGTYARLEQIARGHVKLYWHNGNYQEFVSTSVDDQFLRLVAVGDSCGNRIELAYGQSGLLAQLADPLLQRLYLRCNDDFNVVAVGDQTGRLWQYEYHDGSPGNTGEKGELKSARTPKITIAHNRFRRGKLISYTYVRTSPGNNKRHKIDSIQDAWGNSRPAGSPAPPLAKFKYDSNGRIEHQTIDQGSYNFTYATGETTVQDRNNNEKIYRFAGTVGIQATLASDYIVRDGQDFHYRFQYNSQSEISLVQTPQGAVTQMHYDELASDPVRRGNLTELKRLPVSGRTREVYSTRAVTDFNTDPGTFRPTELVWSYTYEPQYGELKTETDPDGLVTVYSYDFEDPSIGRKDRKIVKVEYPEVTLGHLSGGIQSRHKTMAYNNFGDILEEVNENGVVTTYGYYRLKEANGRLGQTIVRTAHAPSGRLASVRHDSYVHQRRDASLGPHTPVTERIGYDKWGFVAENSNGLNNRFRNRHNELGQVVISWDPEGQNQLFWYDENDNLTQQRYLIMDTRFSADMTTTPSRNRYDKNEYDRLGNLTKSIQDATGLNLITVIEYDANDNVRFIRSPVSQRASNSRPDRIVELKYNKRDLVKMQIHAPALTPQMFVKLDYDDDGLLIKRRDAHDVEVNYIYNAWGHLIATSDRLGNMQVTKTDATGQPWEYIVHGSADGTPNPNSLRNLSEQYLYRDQAGRVVASVEKAYRLLPTATGFRRSRIGYGRKTIRHFYNPAGNLVGTIGARGHQMTYLVDANGNTISESSPQTGTSTFKYDAGSNLRQITVPGPGSGVINYRMTYDKVGRMLSRDVPGKGTMQYRYDTMGNQRMVQDGLGNRSYTLYDTVGRTIKIDRELRQHGRLKNPGASSYNPVLSTIVSKYEYDENDNLLTIKDGADKLLIKYTYNDRDQKDSVTLADDRFQQLGRDDNPGPSIYRYEYWENGLINKVTSADGMVTNHLFDATGRLANRFVTAPSGTSTSGTTEQVFTYDGAGRCIKATDSNGHGTKQVEIQIEYDSLNNVWQDAQTEDFTSTSAREFTARAQYDEQGYLDKLNYPSGFEQNHDFDMMGRLDSVTHVSSYLFNNNYMSRRDHHVPGSFLNLKHNSKGQLTDRLQYARQMHSILQGEITQYDERGMPHVVIDPTTNKAKRMHYDSAYRVDLTYSGIDGSQLNSVPKQQTVHVYDAHGNLAHRDTGLLASSAAPGGGYTVNHYLIGEARINNLAGQVGQNVVLDNPVGGSATQSIQQYHYDKNGNLVRDANYRYQYDGLNRLTGVRQNTSAAPLIAEFRYDALGRRIVKNNTRYVYHEQKLLEEIAPNGTDRTRYFHDAEGIRSMDMLSGTGQVNNYFLYEDRGGTVKCMSDQNGNLVECYGYDPMSGKPTLLSPHGAPRNWSTARGNWILHQGQYFDVETGLYLVGSRYYHPSAQRMLQRDPVALDQNLNAYSLSGHNSEAFADPTGNVPVAIPIGLYYAAGFVAGAFAATEAANYLGGKEWGEYVSNFSPIHSAAENYTGYHLTSVFNGRAGRQLETSDKILNWIDVASAGLTIGFAALKYGAKAAMVTQNMTKAARYAKGAAAIGAIDTAVTLGGLTYGAFLANKKGQNGWLIINAILLGITGVGAGQKLANVSSKSVPTRGLGQSAVGFGSLTVYPAGRRGPSLSPREISELFWVAEQIHGVLHPVSRKNRTTAVLKTDKGYIIGVGAQDISLGQQNIARNALPDVEIVKVIGGHAEQTVLMGAKHLGHKPELLVIAGPKPICSEICQSFVEGFGGIIIHPRMAYWEPARRIRRHPQL